MMLLALILGMGDSSSLLLPHGYKAVEIEDGEANLGRSLPYYRGQ
jgi:hypothetical protein